MMSDLYDEKPLPPTSDEQIVAATRAVRRFAQTDEEMEQFIDMLGLNGRTVRLCASHGLKQFQPQSSQAS